MTTQARGKNPYMGHYDDPPFIDSSGPNVRKHAAVRMMTAVIMVETHGGSADQSIVLRDAIIISNNANDYWRIRGLSINKVILIGLKREHVLPDIINALEVAMVSAKSMGITIPVVEV